MKGFYRQAIYCRHIGNMFYAIHDGISVFDLTIKRVCQWLEPVVLTRDAGLNSQRDKVGTHAHLTMFMWLCQYDTSGISIELRGLIYRVHSLHI